MTARSSGRHLGRDLLVTPFFHADSWSSVDLTPRPRQRAHAGERLDLDVAAGADALRQALVLRLLTPLGSLAALGHAAYGSRLHELIGKERTPELVLRARAFILQVVAQERRVERVVRLDVTRGSTPQADTLRIELSVQPTGGGDPIALAVEVAP